MIIDAKIKLIEYILISVKQEKLTYQILNKYIV